MGQLLAAAELFSLLAVSAQHFEVVGGWRLDGGERGPPGGRVKGSDLLGTGQGLYFGVRLLLHGLLGLLTSTLLLGHLSYVGRTELRAGQRTAILCTVLKFGCDDVLLTLVRDQSCLVRLVL